MALNPAFKKLLGQVISDNESNNMEILLSQDKLPLYQYQKEGRDFLVQRKRGIIADEMGLGKTIQALAVIKCEDIANISQIIIIGTKNTKPVWQKEIKKWLNEESTIVDISKSVFDGVETFRNPEHRFIICNYEQLRSIVPFLTPSECRFDYIICDEFHKVRNRKTATRKSTKDFISMFPMAKVIGITGTPLVNSPRDLFSVLNILDPTRYPSEDYFLQEHFYIRGGYYKKSYVHRNVKRFQEAMVEVMIRREAKDVLDLPKVRKIDHPVYLEGEQLRIYNQMTDAFYVSIEGKETVSTAYVVAQIARLKQIALSPDLIFPGHCAHEGKKYEELLDLLEQIEGKVIVVSCFARYLRSMKTELDKIYQTRIIDGKTSVDDRSKAVDDFQNNPDVRIIFLSSKAGGESITLTAGNNMIYMDKPWTPAEEDQVLGRMNRIGQEQKMCKYYLRAEETIEQYIEEVIASKRQMFGDSIPVSTVLRMIRGY